MGGVSDDVQICDFLYADNCAVTTEEMTDEVLTETFRDRSDDNEPWEDDSASAMPSAKEVLDAIDLLRRAAGSLDDDAAALCSLMSYERVHMLLILADMMAATCALSRLKKVQEKKKFLRARREEELAKLQPKGVLETQDHQPRNILQDDSGDEDILFT
ncbi:hypothetical protein HPB49_000564 [Dermacentor silvarum]|uniref:Uncharacterized protein n=1 Tax=Dermacentor silvarum TaxID=543639 RepID=A0ACB8CCP4_DERSI|nr:hypothetical protein HPB49_000564 [Dermacentor silvarum]